MRISTNTVLSTSSTGATANVSLKNNANWKKIISRVCLVRRRRGGVKRWMRRLLEKCASLAFVPRSFARSRAAMSRRHPEMELRQTKSSFRRRMCMCTRIIRPITVLSRSVCRVKRTQNVRISSRRNQRFHAEKEGGRRRCTGRVQGFVRRRYFANSTRIFCLRQLLRTKSSADDTCNLRIS